MYLITAFNAGLSELTWLLAKLRITYDGKYWLKNNGDIGANFEGQINGERNNQSDQDEGESVLIA